MHSQFPTQLLHFQGPVLHNTALNETDTVTKMTDTGPVSVNFASVSVFSEAVLVTNGAVSVNRLAESVNDASVSVNFTTESVNTVTVSAKVAWREVIPGPVSANSASVSGKASPRKTTPKNPLQSLPPGVEQPRSANPSAIRKGIMANKIKLDLQGISVPDKVQFIRQLIVKLTGNPNFPAPNPTLIALAALADTLEAAYNKQQTDQQTAKTSTTALGTAEDTADAGLNSLANHVEEVSHGSKEKIESAGLTVRAPKTNTTSLDAPQNVSVTAGDNEGELDLVWEPNKKATGGFEIQISIDPFTSTSWQHADNSTSSKTTLTGLPSGSKIWVRIRALGPKKIKSPWSDPAVKRVP